MLMACPLALALAETSRRLSRRSITEVHHVGTTLCRTMRHAPRLSQHALGLAVDVIVMARSSVEEISWKNTKKWLGFGPDPS